MAFPMCVGCSAGLVHGLDKGVDELEVRELVDLVVVVHADDEVQRRVAPVDHLRPRRHHFFFVRGRLFVAGVRGHLADASFSADVPL